MAHTSRWLRPFKVDGIMYDQRWASLQNDGSGHLWTTNYGATIPLLEFIDDHEWLNCDFCHPTNRGVVWKEVIGGNLPRNG